MDALLPTTTEVASGLCLNGCGRPRSIVTVSRGIPIPTKDGLADRAISYEWPFCDSCTDAIRSQPIPGPDAEVDASTEGWESHRRDERISRRRARLIEDTGRRLAGYRLSTYPYAPEGRLAALRSVEGWLADGAHANLFLHGPAGEGKTGLAVAAAHELVDRGAHVRFFVGRGWLEEMRRSFARIDEDSGELADAELAAQRAGVLVLDDLGSERGTPWALERLLSLVDWRYRKELPTIVTSNFAPSGLIAELGKSDMTIGERIVSRLLEGAVKVKFDFGNLRLGGQETRAA